MVNARRKDKRNPNIYAQQREGGLQRVGWDTERDLAKAARHWNCRIVRITGNGAKQTALSPSRHIWLETHTHTETGVSYF